MNLYCLSFSDQGSRLAQRIADGFSGTAFRCKEDLSLSSFTEEYFRSGNALVFVGAIGIAVRAIAPVLNSKTTDPAVVVVDECGDFVVPILSGHLGGANELARKLASYLNAIAVVTTATDRNGVFAVDDWARVQNAVIPNPEWIKTVSGALLAGQSVRMCSEYDLEGDPPKGVVLTKEPPFDISFGIHTGNTGPSLSVVPRILILGVGCKRGVSAEELEAAFQTLTKEHHLQPSAFLAVSSIDLKRDEPGLLQFCENHRLPLYTYSAEELESLEGPFSDSDFVRQTTGTGNVCERSSVLASGGTLLVPKTSYPNITMAVSAHDYQPDWKCFRE